MAASGGGDFVEQPKKLKLYSFWLSPCAFRVRIALNLKGLEYVYEAVDLFKGEQFRPEFSRLNPLNYVPVLVDGSIVMADSLAIILYLEEKYPEHPLLPSDPQKKAINYQVASIVSSSIQPLQNLAVLKSLEEKFNADERQEWVHYHIKRGFEALEKLLKDHVGKYATGDEASLADVFLASELVYSSKTLNMDLLEFPLLNKLNTEYGELPAFHAALPEKQPDAPVT